MKEIKLTHDKVALVDHDLYPYLSQFKWYARRAWRPGNWYAIRTEAGRIVPMHREILHAPEEMQVDHINGDGLDNRRSNLRLCTNAQNACNRGKTRKNTTGYKGVSRQRGRRNVRATIWLHGKSIHLGWYSDPRKAAQAYDRAARQLFGEFARTNFQQGERQ